MLYLSVNDQIDDTVCRQMSTGCKDPILKNATAAQVTLSMGPDINLVDSTASMVGTGSTDARAC